MGQEWKILIAYQITCHFSIYEGWYLDSGIRAEEDRTHKIWCPKFGCDPFYTAALDFVQITSYQSGKKVGYFYIF